MAEQRNQRLDARTKVRLLAGSYLDVCVATMPSSSLQTRFLPGRAFARAEDVLGGVSYGWSDGSYWHLERAMDQLRDESKPRYVWFWRTFVAGEGEGWLPVGDLAPHKAAHAQQGLTRVLTVMQGRTRGNIYVPRAVCLHAGFLESEASEAERPRKVAA